MIYFKTREQVIPNVASIEEAGKSGEKVSKMSEKEAPMKSVLNGTLNPTFVDEKV